MTSGASNRPWTWDATTCLARTPAHARVKQAGWLADNSCSASIRLLVKLLCSCVLYRLHVLYVCRKSTVKLQKAWRLSCSSSVLTYDHTHKWLDNHMITVPIFAYVGPILTKYMITNRLHPLNPLMLTDSTPMQPGQPSEHMVTLHKPHSPPWAHQVLCLPLPCPMPGVQKVKRVLASVARICIVRLNAADDHASLS